MQCSECSQTPREPYLQCSCGAVLCVHCLVLSPQAHPGHRLGLVRTIFDKLSTPTQAHKGPPCFSCRAKVKGRRYKCFQCAEHCLCEDCFQAGKHPGHNYIVEEESRAVTVGACELRTIEELGSGHFGEVSRVLHPRANVSLALKRINLERANSNCKQLARSFQNQLRAHREIHSSAIAAILGFWVEGPYLFLLMQFAGYATIQQRAQEEVCLLQRLGYLEQVACALVCIHAKGFVHKDVKPDNVVVSAGGVARLCDMGVLTPVSEQSRCAPVLWSAPELLDDSLRYSEKVDIYSFGLLTNYLFSGLMHTKTKDGRVILPAPEFFSRLVHECLSQPPERRPSAEDILRFLRRFKQLVLEEVLEEEGLGEAGLRELDFQARGRVLDRAFIRVSQRCQQEDQDD